MVRLLFSATRENRTLLHAQRKDADMESPKFPEFAPGSKDLGRVCIHTITTKPWDIHTAIEKYHDAGIGGISIWRDTIEGQNLELLRRDMAAAEITPVSLVRGGFYTGSEAKTRQDAIDENKRAIDECAGVGAPMVVLVCGATPALTIPENIAQIQAGIEATLEHAAACDVKLAIEPLHPMYADVRSAVTTMRTANDLCEAIDSPQVGVAVDVFHVWWDPELEAQVSRCGQAGNILALHLCDWKTDMADMLNDRGLMGEGIIHLRSIVDMVEGAGFLGFHEVEIFSTRWWAQDQDHFLRQIISAYGEHC